MSLIHPLSAPAAPECLELFKVPDTQTAVLRRYGIEVAPISSQPGGPIEFVVRTDSAEYCDLETAKICGSLRIVDSNGDKMGPDDIAYLINMYAQTLFKQVDVKIGNQILSLHQQMYAYKVIIKNTLRKSDASKATQLNAAGYFKHKAGSMDEILVAGDIDYLARGKLFELSKWVDFEVILDEECLKTGKYLINNVDMSFRFTLNSDEFMIMTNNLNKRFKVETRNFKMKMTLVTVSSGVILGHANALQSGNALYAYMRCEMINHSIGKGESNVNIYNIARKSVPSRLVFGIVSAEAYNGSYSKNPFNFKPYDILSVSLVVNDMVANGAPLDVNFDETNAEGRKYVAAYNQMFGATGTEGKDFGNGVTIEDFKDGYALFCYNLEPFDNPGQFFNLVRTGFVRLSIQFRNPLKETVVLIIYAEHQDMYQIDAARNVLTS